MTNDIYNEANPVFQVDSEIVRNSYENADNFLIIHDDSSKSNACAIYFSGHSIYFPNNEEAFKRNIVEKNRFEWFGLRIKNARKHIFVRDIHKQWYWSGINSKISTPESLLHTLKQETKGFDEIVCMGSSAGGYAAILFGCLLRAKAILAFSGRLEFSSV